jgi:hypothetical protein
MSTADLTPDEVILQPDDYSLPGYISGAYREFQTKQKQAVKITRRQIQYFGERGIPWLDIEKFYNVDRVSLMRWYKADYEKGVANTNIALRNKMVEMALNGNVPVLIFTAKNRLFMSDNGVTQNPETDEDLRQKTTEELMEMVDIITTRAKKTGKKKGTEVPEGHAL